MKTFAWSRFLGMGMLALTPFAAGAQDLAVGMAQHIEVPRIYRLDGVVEASNKTTISAQTSGQVKEVLFDVDDLVEKGDVIVVINDIEQDATLERSRANLRATQAKLQDTQKEYERIKRVYAKKAVSKADMDKVTAARKAVRAEVAAAKAALVQAEQQLTYTQVRAPYAGIVTERFVEVGEVASVGQRLMSGISLQQLRVNIDVPQSLVAAVRNEKSASVYLHGRWIEASKVTVFPVADPATDTFRVRLDLPEGIEGVFPGMYVKAAVAVGLRKPLVVPATSVVYRSEVIGVYVVADDGEVRLRHIRVGPTLADGRYTVLSGLDAGEKVALDPQAAVVRLKDQRKERLSHE